MARKKKRKNIKKRNIKNNNINQCKIADNGQNNVDNKGETQSSKERWMGLTLKTWAVLAIIFILLCFALFVIVPYVLGVMTAIENKNEEEFFQKVFNFSTIVGVIGSVASIASIIMTIIDKRRFKEEKQHSEEMFNNIQSLSVTMSNVSEGVTKLCAENVSMQMDLLNIKDGLLVLQNVDRDADEWSKKEEAKEQVEGNTTPKEK